MFVKSSPYIIYKKIYNFLPRIFLFLREFWRFTYWLHELKKQRHGFLSNCTPILFLGPTFQPRNWLQFKYYPDNKLGCRILAKFCLALYKYHCDRKWHRWSRWQTINCLFFYHQRLKVIACHDSLIDLTVLWLNVFLETSIKRCDAPYFGHLKISWHLYIYKSFLQQIQSSWFCDSHNDRSTTL